MTEPVRAFAIPRVAGDDLAPDEVTKVLKIVRTTAYAKGEHYAAGSRSADLVGRTGVWFFSTKGVVGEPGGREKEAIHGASAERQTAGWRGPSSTQSHFEFLAPKGVAHIAGRSQRPTPRSHIVERAAILGEEAMVVEKTGWRLVHPPSLVTVPLCDGRRRQACRSWHPAC
jgi:hypothetical protein